MLPTDDGRAKLIEQTIRVAQQAMFKAASEVLVIEETRTRAEALVTVLLRVVGLVGHRDLGGQAWQAEKRSPHSENGGPLLPIRKPFSSLSLIVRCKSP